MSDAPDPLLIAYELTGAADWPVTPASPRRDWMDDTPSRFAYRCLPLTVANHAGWVVGSPASFIATWTGERQAPGNIDFAFAPGDEHHADLVSSHFGVNVLTFALPYLFRTEPGVGLTVRGVPNLPKPGAFALEGYVETDWSPFSFTMNWLLLEPGRPVVFEKGEPIAFLQPYDLRLVEDRRPRFGSIHEDPQTYADFEAWRDSRRAFNADLDRQQRWQKFYHRGETVDGRPTDEHHTALRVRPFERVGEAPALWLPATAEVDVRADAPRVSSLPDMSGAPASTASEAPIPHAAPAATPSRGCPVSHAAPPDAQPE